MVIKKVLIIYNVYFTIIIFGSSGIKFTVRNI